MAGLRFTDARVRALLHVLLIFRMVVTGFTARDLRASLAPLLGVDVAALTPGKVSYDLRRLRRHGLIERLPGAHRYRVTDTGLRHALFLTRAHARLLRTGLAEVHDPSPAQPSPLRAASRAYEAAIDRLARRSGLTA